MTEEEAIELLENDEVYIIDSFYREFRTTIADKYTKAFQIVLNQIQDKQEEIKKKDKIIDLIVNRFQQICVTPSLAKYQWKRICSKDLKICEGRLCEDCIKEYFTKKVEKNK